MKTKVTRFFRLLFYSRNARKNAVVVLIYKNGLILNQYNNRKRQQMYDIDTEEMATEKRQDELMLTFEHDLQKMRELADKNTGVSGICASIVACVENKAGTIETSDLRTLDLQNRAIALRLIEMMCTPSMFPDSFRL